MLKTYFKFKMGNYVKHAAKIGRKRAKTITFCGFETYNCVYETWGLKKSAFFVGERRRRNEQLDSKIARIQ